MTLFQLVMVPLLTVLGVHAILPTFRGRRHPLHLIKCATWLIGAILVTFPNASSRAAVAAGIGRGADLIFYFVVVTLIWCFFHLKSRQWTNEEALTKLVQQHALDHAEEIQ